MRVESAGGYVYTVRLLQWLSVKVSPQIVADLSCPRTCLTRSLYDGVVGKFVFATNEESKGGWRTAPTRAMGDQPVG
jgi:hypothetical protein